MLLALDVHYKASYAKTVGVLFLARDKEPLRVITTYTKDVDEYIPGQFYKRELPCLLQAINEVDLNTIDAIIVDGHVYIDNNLSLGLGGHLYNALDKQIPIIGVAKKAFHTNDNTTESLLRGESQTPLYISSIGIDLQNAVDFIKFMHGPHRTPTLLRTLDRLTKTP
ncbi:endonuclease V [Winogradskyella sp. 3972H.M.0a.05]|uniref:endonuclease V n=1 Tax=Winogradskyella sp. 3972H.M.0a.05 TaxID=2950277 RepID=UPI00339A7BC7